MNGLETQIVQGLAGLLTAVVTGVVAYALPKAKMWLTHHTNVQQAQLATTVLNGLGRIADGVVSSFNQSVVSDAKATGKWTPELAAQVKADAVKAVQAQGAALIQLGSNVIGNVPQVIGSLVEQAVVANKASAKA